MRNADFTDGMRLIDMFVLLSLSVVVMEKAKVDRHGTIDERNVDRSLQIVVQCRPLKYTWIGCGFDAEYILMDVS